MTEEGRAKLSFMAVSVYKKRGSYIPHVIFAIVLTIIGVVLIEVHRNHSGRYDDYEEDEY